MSGLLDALGYKGHNVTKIVIEADIKSAVKIYVQEYLDKDKMEEVANLFRKDDIPKPFIVQKVDGVVSVDEKGNVKAIGEVTPLE
jgi:hypothetical protein